MTDTPAMNTWQIRDHIRETQRAHKEASGAFEKRLTDVLEQYAHRRTIEAQMIREVIDLAVGRVAEVEAHHQAVAEATAQAHEMQIARAHKSRDEAVDRADGYRRKVEDWRMVREERTADGTEDASVSFSTGTDHWTVAALEEIAYRLRCGGATDDTRVKANHRTMSARVPAPNMVPMHAPAVSTREAPRPLPDTTRDEELPGWLLVASQVLGSRALVAVLLVCTGAAMILLAGGL